MNSQYLINKNNEGINKLLQHEKDLPVFSIFASVLGWTMEKIICNYVVL